MEKIKEFFILKFRKPLKTDNKNESLKLNRFLGEFIVIIPVALIFNYFALLALSFFCNFIANIKVIIHSHKTYDYLSLFNIKKGLDFLLSQKEIGYFLLLAILGFLGFITIKKAFKMRLNYSDKDIKKGYEATNRWTTLPELYKQYQKIDMNPSIRIKIPLSQEEKDALNSKDKRDMITVIDGRDIKKNYKKYLRKRGDEFKLEGYILSETGEPEYKGLKAMFKSKRHKKEKLIYNYRSKIGTIQIIKKDIRGERLYRPAYQSTKSTKKCRYKSISSSNRSLQKRRRG